MKKSILILNKHEKNYWYFIRNKKVYSFQSNKYLKLLNNYFVKFPDIVILKYKD